MKHKSSAFLKFIILATLTMLVLLSGCGFQSNNDTTAKASKDEKKSEQKVENAVSKVNPIFVDKENKVVKVYAN